MKTIWIAAALLVLVLVGSTALFIYSSVLYHALQEGMERLERAVTEEDWEKARRELSRVEEIWNRTDSSWTPVMDHRQVDRLDESMTRIFHLVKQRSRDELLVEIAVARRLAKRIKDTEVPGIRNIF